MSGLNRMTILGHVGKDPEIREYDGKKLANFPIAVTEKYKSGDSQQETTEWFDVTVWGAQAGVVEKYVTKGKQLFVEGRIRTSKWKDKDGNDKYGWGVHATKIILIGGGQKQDPDKDDLPY